MASRRRKPAVVGHNCEPWSKAEVVWKRNKKNDFVLVSIEAKSKQKYLEGNG
jgi:hypothetical protein